MAQASSIAYVDSEGGTAHVSRHNSVGAAELSSHSGTSTPAYAAAGTKWLDTSGTPYILNMYDGADDIPIGTVNASTNEFIPYNGSIHGQSVWAAKAAPLVQDATAIFTWTGTDLLWTGHLYAKAGGDGTHWATGGYYTIDCPTSGTVVAAGAATNQTATAAGIPMAADEALYYIPDINAADTFVQANLRLVKLGTDFVVGPHWIFIAQVDGLGGVVLGNGGYLKLWNTPTLLNSWSAAAYSFGYAKDQNGDVEIYIRASGGTTTDATVLYTLPAYYRPPGTINGWMSSSTGSNYNKFVVIRSTGDIELYGASGIISVRAKFRAAA